MNIRHALAAAAAMATLAVASGCAVTRSPGSVGAYIDDAAITTSVKARMAEDRNVDAASIKVETLNGEVMLSGVAKSSLEKSAAESVAMKVKGVKIVRNEIAVRP